MNRKVLLPVALLASAASAFAAPSTVYVEDAGIGRSNTPGYLRFPLSHPFYNSVLNYHTVDGSAVSPRDYQASDGALLALAGDNNASIAIGIPAYVADQRSPPERSFELVLDSAFGFGPEVAFAPRQTFATGRAPRSVVVADFNGDGRPDLLVANSSSNSFSVLLDTTPPGATTPSYAGAVSVTIGNTPLAVAVADINGDGKPDVVVANTGDDTVTLFLNATAPGAQLPTFGGKQTLAVGASPVAIAVGDFDGDGKPDLATANYDSSTSTVLLNRTGTGTFVPAFAAGVEFTTGYFPRSIASADINGDGRVDLVVASSAQSTLSLLLNATPAGAGAAVFAPKQDINAPSFVDAVAVADINGDGKPDLGWTSVFDNSVCVAANITPAGAGTPIFAAAVTIPVDNQATALKFVDLNGDGKPDLVAGNASQRRLSVLLNVTAPGSSTPAFADAHGFDAAFAPDSIAAADVDGNGRMDVISVGDLEDEVSVLLNVTAADSSGASFSAPQKLDAGHYPYGAIAADFNLDGMPDLVSVNGNDGTLSSWINTTVPGAFATSFGTRQMDFLGGTPFDVRAGDFNGDGRPDLAIADYYGNHVAVLLNTTAPGATLASFGPAAIFPITGYPEHLTVADLNGDGRPDIIAAGYNSIVMSVLINATAAGAGVADFVAEQALSMPSSPIAVTLGDINGDGLPDIVGADVGEVAVLINTTTPGSTHASFAAPQSFLAGSEWTDVALADLNGDGRIDIVASSYFVDKVAMMFNATSPGSDQANFGAPTLYGEGPFAGALVTADVDGDGRIDLLFTEGNGGAVTLLRNTTPVGGYVPGFTQLAFSTGQAPLALTTADMNADGKPVLITANAEGTIAVLLNTQYQVSFIRNVATGTILTDRVFSDGFQ